MLKSRLKHNEIHFIKIYLVYFFTLDFTQKNMRGCQGHSSDKHVKLHEL